ncbi:hypothetical protein [Paraburkholderia bryophila]|nr:hypothetical protein [Paraburkholderia bryophila]
MRADDDTDSREYLAERAAIMEIDGGLPRHQAEYYATIATRRFCDRTGRLPPQTAYYEIVTRFMRPREPREPGEARAFERASPD